MLSLESGIQSILDGRAILFVGAGFSQDATNLLGKSIPGGPELCRDFAKLVSFTGDLKLEEAADLILEDLGPDALAAELRKRFTVRTTATWQQDLASLPWHRVYTTNYDNVIERAGAQVARSYTPVTLEDNIYEIPKGDTLCVHLNGYIERLSAANITTHIKLTDTSYVSSSIADTTWAALFRDDIRNAGAVFFVGYSLSDLDLRRILLEDITTRDKSFFAVGSPVDALLSRKITRYGQNIDSTGEQLLSAVLNYRESYVPRSGDDPLLSLSERSAEAVQAPLSDKDFRELLLMGSWTTGKIEESIRSGSKLYLQRSRTKFGADLLDQSDTIAVTSNLGNGKSLFLEGMIYELRSRGYRIFSVNQLTEETYHECETIGQLHGPVALVIDNYERFFKVAVHYRRTAKRGAKLILTARNAVHDLILDDLLNALAVEEIPEVSVNILDHEELEWFVQAFDAYGLWGTHAAEHHSKKFGFLEKTCGSQIQTILLKLLASPDIRSRFEDLFSEASKDQYVLELLMTVMIFTMMGVPVTMSVLQDVSDVRSLNSRLIRGSHIVKEIINFDTNEVLLRSPATAEFILKRIASADAVVPVLVRLARRVHDLSLGVVSFQQLWINFMRFGQLALVLPDDGLGESVVRYYESIKNLRGAQKNPLFWFQYAVAATETGDIQRAKKYYETAYSYADATGFDTFQIDNGFARFLLLEAQTLDSVSEAMQSFRAARQIINRQLQSEHRHYPYRVAAEYQSLLDRFGSRLSDQELYEFELAAQMVLDRAESLEYRLRFHRVVKRAVEAMGYVLHRCDELRSHPKES
jgi:hypothetical protein